MLFSGMARRTLPRAFALCAGGGVVAGFSLAAKAEPSLSELEGRMAAIEAALHGPSAAAVEAKFKQFWPRKIMILFGPP